MPYILNQSNGWGSTYNLIEVNGHWLSVYPIVSSVIALPIYVFYLLPLLIFPGGFEYYSVLSKSCAALLMAFASMLFFQVSIKLFKPRTALITTLIFAFGTLTWATSSQSLWQHGTSELLFIIAILCVIKNEFNNDIKNFVIIGAVFGLFIFNRPSDFFIFIPILYYVWLNREFVYAFLFWSFVSAFPFLWYNIACFGSPFGGYSSMGIAIATTPVNLMNFINGIVGLLFSPNRGLFVFSPILIFALWGMWIVWCRKDGIIRNILLFSIPCMVLSVCFYAIQIDALLGGWSYGPRYLLTIIPILCIFTGYGIEKFIENKQKIIIGIIIVLLVFSVAVEANGAWFYPYNSWNERSDLNDRNRIWDINDNIIKDSFLMGINKTESVSLMVFPTLPRNVGYFVFYER
jgi:hypothetical protein